MSIVEENERHGLVTSSYEWLKEICLEVIYKLVEVTGLIPWTKRTGGRLSDTADSAERYSSSLRWGDGRGKYKNTTAVLIEF